MATHSSILAWRIPMDRGARQATAHEVAKSWTGLRDFHFSTSPLAPPGKSLPSTNYSLSASCPMPPLTSVSFLYWSEFSG